MFYRVEDTFNFHTEKVYRQTLYRYLSLVAFNCIKYEHTLVISFTLRKIDIGI